ncbi:hypothetical protein FO519_005515 [Halicephalobus sp. NKZ332]|nr:hypothetical protein FO519_005515 [Halicephalobus sp. NKZ332]
MSSGRYFLVTVGFLLCLQGVLSDYTVNVLLNEFNNGQGFLADGTHCNDFWFSGQGCNIQLKIAVDFGGSGNVTYIDLGNVTSNANSIIFKQQTYGAWVNPSSFPMPGQYSGFSLHVTALEAENGKSIDSFQTPFINGTQINDFMYFSHSRLDGNLEPTMIAFAWFVQGNVSNPPSTSEPSTVKPTSPIPSNPMDCEAAFLANSLDESQLVKIGLTNGQVAEVFCEYDSKTKTVQTVFQSRGSDNQEVKFEEQTYEAYKNPIGKAGPNNNYWMGLENLNAFTIGRGMVYNMTIITCCNNTPVVFQDYYNVTVSDAGSGYKISGTGTYPTGLSYKTMLQDFGQSFKTVGSWTTSPPVKLCNIVQASGAQNSSGGWWFGNCVENLNGHYYPIEELEPETCAIDDTQLSSTGPGIELYNGEDMPSKIPMISYTRVRMAFYRANGKGITHSTKFCDPPVNPSGGPSVTPMNPTDNPSGSSSTTDTNPTDNPSGSSSTTDTNPTDNPNGSSSTTDTSPTSSNSIPSTTDTSPASSNGVPSTTDTSTIVFTMFQIAASMLVLWVVSVSFVVSWNLASAEHGIIILLTEIEVSGYLENNQPCSPYTELGIKCFPRPKICIEPALYATDDMDQCGVGSYIDLGILNNTNDFTFSENAQYSGWRNPNIFIFLGSFPPYYIIKMKIWNADGTNYQPIGSARWNLTTDSGPKPESLPPSGNIKKLSFSWDHYPPSIPLVTSTPGSTDETSPQDTTQSTISPGTTPEVFTSSSAEP